LREVSSKMVRSWSMARTLSCVQRPRDAPCRPNVPLDPRGC
jgi:hypothetical protein